MAVLSAPGFNRIQDSALHFLLRLAEAGSDRARLVRRPVPKL